MVNVSRDFKEFLELLNVHKVKYLIVGGYAVAFHSRPRYTDDIDLWIEADRNNAEKVLNVLQDFGFPVESLTTEELSQNNKIIQLGLPPHRIDIITSIDGVSFNHAFENRVNGKFADVPVWFISLEDILVNKRSSGREKDRADVQWIEKYRREEY